MDTIPKQTHIATQVDFKVPGGTEGTGRTCQLKFMLLSRFTRGARPYGNACCCILAAWAAADIASVWLLSGAADAGCGATTAAARTGEPSGLVGAAPPGPGRGAGPGRAPELMGTTTRAPVSLLCQLSVSRWFVRLYLTTTCTVPCSHMRPGSCETLPEHPEDPVPETAYASGRVSSVQLSTCKFYWKQRATQSPTPPRASHLKLRR